MKPNFKLTQKTDPQTFYETQQESFLLGKSQECEMVIAGPHISEVQARIGKKNNKYFIKNLGEHPIMVNGRSTAAQFLKDGDEITFGKTKFLLQLPSNAEELAKTSTLDAKTMVFTSPSEDSVGPRLVCTNSVGKSKIYPLKKDKVIIGRSGEAHLKLVHPLVSRKHCVIEKRKDAFFVRNISTTNPLFLNDRHVSEKRLYTGDQLKIATFSITFISDRPEDVQPVKEKIVTQNKRSGWGLWLTAILLMTSVGYFVYLHAYTPWLIRQTLQSVSQQIESGNHLAAQNKLKHLLKSNLSPAEAHKAKQLLAQSVIAVTQQKDQNENLEKAKEYLTAYLADYGGGEEAKALWERLDYYRLVLGQRLEDSKEYQPALRQYAAIREGSMYFAEAQKAARRIWLAYQQPSREEQTVAQLLQEAENHFNAKRYLTPVNQNAYAVYQAVLAIEPRHELALARIEQIKTFYREQGEICLKKGQWSKALTYFERYYFIDPEAPDIQEKIGLCRQKLTTPKTTQKTAQSPKAKPDQKTDEKQEEIKRLLEESGAESSWLMQYLFEDQKGEKDSETPW